jgi:hypothetical protein
MRTFLVVGAACASACAGAGPSAAPVATRPPPAGPSCTEAERRQLDFWVGRWDVVLHHRRAPDSEVWDDARGTQHIEAVLGGCAIAESFAADGPGTPWAGRSLSSWQPALGKWRQAWVDDQGGYLAFEGGLEDGAMTLYGEPRTLPDGTVVRMRMRWLDVRTDSLRWEWQRTVDAGATWRPMLKIDYQRRR